MIITIHCLNDGEDALMPFLANADYGNVEARGATAAEATDSARGICLCALGQMQSPPMLVEFKRTGPCGHCYDGGACLPGGCGVTDCDGCGKACPHCKGTCVLAVDEPTSEPAKEMP